MKINKTYKFRLYPNKTQVKSLNIQLEGHRFLYNEALAERKNAYGKDKKNMSFNDQKKQLIPAMREFNEFIRFCNCSSLQETLRRLDSAYQSFFRRVKNGGKPGYPRFKGKGRFNTITYPALGNGCQITEEKKLYLQNVGDIKVKWHREIEGLIKIVRTTHRNGKWYVSFIVECSPALLPKTGLNVGIDMGLTHFFVSSNREFADNPRLLGASLDKIKKVRQKLSRQKKGSVRRKKTRGRFANLHGKVVDQRKDFHHKAAHYLVNTYDTISVEKLGTKQMMKNNRLARSISDVAWAGFHGILMSKAENAGKRVVEVDPKGTSQECSRCGAIVKKSLYVRQHVCHHCSLSIDRDLNASINILKRARAGPSALALIHKVPPRSRSLSFV